MDNRIPDPQTDLSHQVWLEVAQADIGALLVAELPPASGQASKRGQGLTYPRGARMEKAKSMPPFGA